MLQSLVVHKYGPLYRGPNEIQMPINARILSTQMLDDQIVLYALVDRNEGVFETRRFGVLYTGEGRLETSWMYLGTCIGPRYLVHHVFELCG